MTFHVHGVDGAYHVLRYYHHDHGQQNEANGRENECCSCDAVTQGAESRGAQDNRGNRDVRDSLGEDEAAHRKEGADNVHVGQKNDEN